MEARWQSEDTKIEKKKIIPAEMVAATALIF